MTSLKTILSIRLIYLFWLIVMIIKRNFVIKEKVMRHVLFLIVLWSSTACTTKYWIKGNTCNSGFFAPPAYPSYDDAGICQKVAKEERELDNYKIVIEKSSNEQIVGYECKVLRYIYLNGETIHEDSNTYSSSESCLESPLFKKLKAQKNKQFKKDKIIQIEKLIARENNLAQFRDQLLKNKIAIGMPVSGLIYSWGKPDRINSHISASGSDDQYVYDKTYVYVTNGKIRAIDSSTAN